MCIIWILQGQKSLRPSEQRFWRVPLLNPFGELMNHNKDHNGSLKGISRHYTESCGITPQLIPHEEKPSLRPEGYLIPVYKNRCFGRLDYQPLFGEMSQHSFPDRAAQMEPSTLRVTAIHYGSLLVLRSTATIQNPAETSLKLTTPREGKTDFWPSKTCNWNIPVSNKNSCWGLEWNSLCWNRHAPAQMFQSFPLYWPPGLKQASSCEQEKKRCTIQGTD